MAKWLFCFCIALVSCLPQQTQKKELEMKTFFEKEIERLNSQKPTVTKTIVMNGKTETIKTNKINWKNELKVFVDHADLGTKNNTGDIEIILEKQNQLYSFAKELKYNAQKGYSIKGSQNMKMVNGIQYEIVVNYKMENK